MIYGLAYLEIVRAISAGWLVLATFKKPQFIVEGFKDRDM